jgi:hypothetical protein
MSSWIFRVRMWHPILLLLSPPQLSCSHLSTNTRSSCANFSKTFAPQSQPHQSPWLPRSPRTGLTSRPRYIPLPLLFLGTQSVITQLTLRLLYLSPRCTLFRCKKSPDGTAGVHALVQRAPQGARPAHRGPAQGKPPHSLACTLIINFTACFAPLHEPTGFAIFSGTATRALPTR